VAECLCNNFGNGAYSQVKPTYVRTWGLKRGGYILEGDLLAGDYGINISIFPCLHVECLFWEAT